MTHPISRYPRKYFPIMPCWGSIDDLQSGGRVQFTLDPTFRAQSGIESTASGFAVQKNGVAQRKRVHPLQNCCPTASSFFIKRASLSSIVCCVSASGFNIGKSRKTLTAEFIALNSRHELMKKRRRRPVDRSHITGNCQYLRHAAPDSTDDNGLFALIRLCGNLFRDELKAF